LDVKLQMSECPGGSTPTLFSVGIGVFNERRPAGSPFSVLLRTGELQVSNVRKLDSLAKRMRTGESFDPVRVVIDLGGFWCVNNVADMYKVAASLTAGFSHVPAITICGPWR
jgi:hypothetical protein